MGILEESQGHSLTVKRRLKELFYFIYKEALACIFPVYILLLLALFKAIPLPIARYDALFLACIAMQGIMLATKLETLDELKVICVFHLLGLSMELFKTHMGSWSYPEAAYFKVGGVPLYSGFMYASVASYLIQAWRHFDLKLIHFPPRLMVIPLGAAIYLNFFSHHYMIDLRWYLALAILIIFAKSSVAFSAYQKERYLPLNLAFVFIAFFVWIAENVATYLDAWHYPHQQGAWQMVDLAKIGSWSLLIIVSFLIVAELKRLKSSLTTQGH
ncbi:MAG: DUF817 domain-containing protein [Deinococcales bacterium]